MEVILKNYLLPFVFILYGDCLYFRSRQSFLVDRVNFLQAFLFGICFFFFAGKRSYVKMQGPERVMSGGPATCGEANLCHRAANG
jgi:hypothetical protein